MKSTICVYYSDRKCHGMPRTEKRNLISSPNIQSFKNIHFEFLLIYEMKIIRDCLKKRRGRQRRDRHDETKREGDGARESRELEAGVGRGRGVVKTPFDIFREGIYCRDSVIPYAPKQNHPLPFCMALPL